MDKELIDHIKDSLQLHEEAYRPGAWESFAMPEEKKRNKFIYWPLWSAAVLFLIIGSIFLLQNKEPAFENSVVKTSKTKQRPQNTPVKSSADAIQDEPDKSTTDEHSLSPKKQNGSYVADGLSIPNQKVNLQVSTKPKNSSDENYSFESKPAENFQLSGIPKSENITSGIVVHKAEFRFNRENATQRKLTFEQLLEQDSRKSIAKAEKNKSPQKWAPGVFIAPSIGNDSKVNMNYGFSLSYHLADKLSISSGVAYSALSTTSNPAARNGGLMNDAVTNAPGNLNAIAYASESKNLESVNASVSGINIPLELKYNINSRFYTGVGVSALAILNNKQNNNYLVSSAKNTTVANSMGFADQKMLLVTERVSEPSKTSSATADKYIGFYNFSIGYKQKISKKNDFAVEPFLRLPMKTFSNDNLNLTNGGIRLKFDF